MKAVVFTLGCKVNEVESAMIMKGLEDRGFKVTDKLSPADIYVLNTCAVTREAEKKSRQLMARVKKFNPDAKIFVCGCASQKDEKPFMQRGAYFVCGARDKGRILKEICGESVLPPPKQIKTRAFIKLQDGCNNFCSYCIIPYLRGREVSRPMEEVLCEIKNTPSPEVVLTGINLSAYGYFLPLLNGLKEVNKRIRLGSLECNIITDVFLQALKELPDFAPQFHVSLQSGSNAVLKAMNRHYTRDEYIEKCNLILKYFPDAAITTDIIAGFASETEEDFIKSLSIIDEVGFARVHAFEFSPREGTKAYSLKDLPPDIKRARLNRLIARAKQAEEKYISRFLGKSERIIAEEYDGEYTFGYTSNYIRVYVSGKLTQSEFYPVKLIEPFKDGALAIIDGN